MAAKFRVDQEARAVQLEVEVQRVRAEQEAAAAALPADADEADVDGHADDEAADEHAEAEALSSWIERVSDVLNDADLKTLCKLCSGDFGGPCQLWIASELEEVLKTRRENRKKAAERFSISEDDVESAEFVARHGTPEDVRSAGKHDQDLNAVTEQVRARLVHSNEADVDFADQSPGAIEGRNAARIAAQALRHDR